jgi:glycosyltransferase involved in cell wall biosynthesis
MAGPLVSVITPTWQRHELLLRRCVPSVAAQSYRHVEHVIVSDGPDQELMNLAAAAMDAIGGNRLVFRYLAAHDPAARWGHHARLHGLEAASGDYIAYLDDDNAFRPDHIQKLVAALEANPDAGFAYSAIMMHNGGSAYVVGAVPPPTYGQIDTSAIMHRRGLLQAATWRDEGQPTIDWDITERWLQAGAGWAHVPEVTADYYFT